MAARTGTPSRSEHSGPELAFGRAEVGVLRLRLSGDWRLKSGLPAPAANRVSEWGALKTQWVCTLEGEWYNKEFAKKYGFDALTFVGRAAATEAALANRCVGFLDDDTHAVGVLQNPGMRKILEMPLETQSCVQ